MASATLLDPTTMTDVGDEPSSLVVREPDVPYEVLDGRIVEMPLMSAYATRIAFRIANRLQVFAEAQSLGSAATEILVRLPLGEGRTRDRRPDAAFVSTDRWPLDRPIDPDANAWDVVPDLAVEVVSPNDLAEDQLEKVHDYFRAGVRLVWVVYPRLRTAHVFEGPDRIRVVDEAGSLEGEPVLPGFRLPIAGLFDPVRPAAPPPTS